MTTRPSRMRDHSKRAFLCSIKGFQALHKQEANQLFGFELPLLIQSNIQHNFIKEPLVAIKHLILFKSLAFVPIQILPLGCRKPRAYLTREKERERNDINVH